LHQDVGPAVPDSALDLRGGELAVVVPLVVCLLGLSAYPALISGHAFGGNKAIVPDLRPVLAGRGAVPLPKRIGTTVNIDNQVLIPSTNGHQVFLILGQDAAK
jgi:hypothetical protein